MGKEQTHSVEGPDEVNQEKRLLSLSLVDSVFKARREFILMIFKMLTLDIPQVYTCIFNGVGLTKCIFWREL